MKEYLYANDLTEYTYTNNRGINKYMDIQLFNRTVSPIECTLDFSFNPKVFTILPNSKMDFRHVIFDNWSVTFSCAVSGLYALIILDDVETGGSGGIPSPLDVNVASPITANVDLSPITNRIDYGLESNHEELLTLISGTNQHLFDLKQKIDEVKAKQDTELASINTIKTDMTATKNNTGTIKTDMTATKNNVATSNTKLDTLVGWLSPVYGKMKISRRGCGHFFGHLNCYPQTSSIV